MTAVDGPELARFAPQGSAMRFSILTILKLTLYAAIVAFTTNKLASVTTTEIWIFAILMILFSPLIFAAEIIDWALGNTRRK